MPTSLWSNTPVLTVVCSALEKNSPREKPVDGQEQVESGQVQQVSWDQSAVGNTLTSQSTASVASQPIYHVVRDNAPSSTMVVATLIAFGVFSLVLCLWSMPHYWFHGDSTRWRERKGW